MDDLIAKLVRPEQQAHAKLLLEDPDTCDLIRRQLSQMAEDDTEVLPQKSFSWILCKLATFGAKETDTLRIYQAFVSELTQLGQMCRVISGEGRHSKFDSASEVASRLTIGLGLFYEQVARRHQYHAAPSPHYYRRVAAGCFAATGYQSIAVKLPEWLEFLQTNFVLPKLK